MDTLDKCLMEGLISLRRLVGKTTETEVTARKKKNQQSVHQLGGCVFREKQIKNLFSFFIFYFVQAP